MNNEEIIERMKEYNYNNRELINEKASEKIICECGCELSRDNLTKHHTTIKHQIISWKIMK